jgi:hypothetical protein
MTNHLALGASEMTKPAYKAGDVVTVVLSDYDAADLNHNDHAVINPRQIIHHKQVLEPKVWWDVYAMSGKRYTYDTYDLAASGEGTGGTIVKTTYCTTTNAVDMEIVE